MLLRPAADSPLLTGIYQEQFPNELPYLDFRYRVIRVWQMPVETFLTGGLGTLPLAPVSAVAERDLPAVVGRIGARLAQEATPEQGIVLEAATVLLTGLRLPADKVIELYQGANFMSIIEDSSVYQMILDKGKREGAIEELRKTLLRQGQRRFGLPDQSTREALAAI